jgi:hypothetical protein
LGDDDFLSLSSPKVVVAGIFLTELDVGKDDNS